MVLKIDLLQTAKKDAFDAQDWYDDASPGLGDAFTDEFLSALDVLAERPGIGSRRFAYLYPGMDLRTWSMDRFPFRIFYAVHGDVLRIYRVCHQWRNVTKSLLRRAK
ncbi:type II toxin-antitoxin system RelE/ParE family toxin [Burkholderiaceae bacterium DAT-1]|nr:type II toxin-antitoxin system RelE/ParE family toxin [Burkholderiaceae bacterium DAT-1]